MAYGTQGTYRSEARVTVASGVTPTKSLSETDETGPPIGAQGREGSRARGLLPGEETCG
jgi:hypothetical protein